MSAHFTLKVLSYNIHKGFAARKNRFVLEQIRAAVRMTKADVIFLQEVLGEHRGYSKRIKQWPLESQFEYVADSLWPHFAYGRNAVYDEGHHGNAILSKYPILRFENEDISNSALEKRGLLHAVIKPCSSDAETHLICVHFGLFESDRQMQARKLCQRLRSRVPAKENVVVAGDFNDWTLRLSPLLKREAGLEEAYHALHNRHARTFPARMPLLRLDRIYCRGFEAERAEVLRGRPWVELSDHSPLVADLVA